MLNKMMNIWIPGDRMTNQEIAKELKRKFDYEVVIVALVGSHVHGLATEDSDYDYIAFAEPTAEMIYKAKKVNEQCRIGKDIDVKLKDIRDLIPLLSAQNPNFLDIFLDGEVYVRREYAWIFNRRTESFLTSYDPVCLARSALGMAFNYLQKPSNESVANAMYLNNMAYYAITSGRFPNAYALRFSQEMVKEKFYSCVLYGFDMIKRALDGRLYVETNKTMEEYSKWIEENLCLLCEYIESGSKNYSTPDKEYLDVLNTEIMETVFTSIFSKQGDKL